MNKIRGGEEDLVASRLDLRTASSGRGSAKPAGIDGNVWLWGDTTPFWALVSEGSARSADLKTGRHGARMGRGALEELDLGWKGSEPLRKPGGHGGGTDQAPRNALTGANTNLRRPSGSDHRQDERA